MQLRLAKPLLAADNERLAKILLTDGESLTSYRDYFDVDLSKLSLKTLQKAERVASDCDVRGAKTLVRDIQVWIKACESVKGAKSVRARSTRAACSLLIEYLRHSPRKHLYQRLAESDGVTLTYFVEDICFHPRISSRGGDTTPDHVTLSLMYEEFGYRQENTLVLWPSDCLGMTPPEMLHKAGYLQETEALREDYEFWCETYGGWKDQIGKQFLAVGEADDNDVDGNDDESTDSWWRRRSKANSWRLDKDGVPSRVVVDIFKETDEEDRSQRDCNLNPYFWSRQINVTTEDTELEGDDDEDTTTKEIADSIEIPVHPYVVCFDLTKHKRLRVHVGNLTEYKYDPTIRDRLILPEKNARLIDTLLAEKATKFRDIVKGKSGGTIILCQGRPGTGKTLTAEIYAETLGKALFTVQCSQLGIDAMTLETNLLKCLARGRRWGAVMLLDEADVYVHERGSDLQQNAIVGVFLRVLEYHSGVLFMTTNRDDLVDDAILSRCTARIPYKSPRPEDQKAIWRVLAAANEIKLSSSTIAQIVEAHPKLSGRDIKNLLKLAAMVAHDRKEAIDAKLIAEVKLFKPTSDEED